MKDEGHEVVVLTSLGDQHKKIIQSGFNFEEISIDRSSMNPFFMLKSILRVMRIYKYHQPDLVHHIALKPIIIGSIACFFNRRIKAVNTFPGLGILFTKEGMVFSAIRIFLGYLFRFLLNRDGIINTIQNKSDRDFFISEIKVRKSKLRLILGSGVNTEFFQASKEPINMNIRATMVSRILTDKGIGTFVESSRILKDRGVNCIMTLVGWIDQGNKYSAISEEDISNWVKNGLIDYWGRSENVPNVWRQSHICVFPTMYPEGLPKCLLEAASCARPIVTTDIPGCLEIVNNKENGVIIPQDSPEDLSDAIQFLVENKDIRIDMGNEGRKKVISSFSDDVVINKTKDVYRELLIELD